MTVRNFFGGTLMAIGALIMFLTGACTFYFGSLSILGGSITSESFELMLTFGGLPFAVGFAIWFAGRFLFKRKGQDAPDLSSEDQNENH